MCVQQKAHWSDTRVDEWIKVRELHDDGQRGGSLASGSRERSLKRVNGCDTRCSSVRVTTYYELNNVMIGTAPVTRRISCVPCNGCLKTPPTPWYRPSLKLSPFHTNKQTNTNTHTHTHARTFVSVSSPCVISRTVINTVTEILCVSDRWSSKFPPLFLAAW